MKIAIFAGLVAVLGSLSGCVSKDAGYQDVRKVVAARSGHDVRWSYLEGDDQARGAVRELATKPLNAERAVRLALLNNAELQAAFEELGIARAELVGALAVPNPSAEGSLRFRKRQSATIDLSVTEDLSQLLLLPLRNGAAQAELDAAKLEVAGRALDLVFQVRAAYYAYLADRQALEFRRTVLDAAEASAAVAQGLHDAGNLTELDLDSERVLSEEARLNLASAETALVASKERLSALMGFAGQSNTWEAPGRLAEPDAEMPLADLEAKAIDQSLDLLAIRRRFVAADKRASLATAKGWLPGLKGGVTAEREEREWSYGPLAEVELPLFYQGQGDVARAQAEMRRQQQLLTARAVQIRAAARTVASRLAAARARAIYIKDVLLPSRERILQQTQLHYNAMSVSVFQLLMARRDEVETAQSYVEALRDYWTARAEAEQLKSGRIP